MKRKKTVAPGRNKKVGLILFLIIASIATLVVVAGDWRETTTGVTVTVRGAKLADPRTLIELAAISDTALLANIDLLEVKKRVETDPYVREVVLRREPPRRLEIDVIERRPIAVLLNIKATDWFIDEDGYVIPAGKAEMMHDLPVITGAEMMKGIKAGARVTDPRLRHAVEILKTAQELDPQVGGLFSEISLGRQNDLLLYTLDAGVPVIFGTSVEAERKLLAFKAFWKDIALRHDLTRLEYVDLRFKDEVVLRWRQERVESTPDPMQIDSINTTTE